MGRSCGCHLFDFYYILLVYQSHLKIKALLAYWFYYATEITDNPHYICCTPWIKAVGESLISACPVFSIHACIALYIVHEIIFKDCCCEKIALLTSTTGLLWFNVHCTVQIRSPTDSTFATYAPKYSTPRQNPDKDE